jgi:hypothetical protein
MKQLIFIVWGSLLSCLCACSGGSDKPKEIPKEILDPSVVGNTGLSIPDNRHVDNYNILFIGNSHIGSNDLSGIVAQLIQSDTQKIVSTSLSGSQRYLDERINDGVTKEKITSETWTHVILQAQKYSQSQSVEYSTSAAEYWAGLSKSLEATPIFFPEHPQKGDSTEGEYVYQIHKNISDNESACVAPIGPAWDLALDWNSKLTLHSPDGNHAGVAGTFLSALVFYQVITGLPAEYLPYITTIDISEDIQLLLRKVATDTINTYGDCIF